MNSSLVTGMCLLGVYLLPLTPNSPLLLSMVTYIALIAASVFLTPPHDFASIELDILITQKSLAVWPDPLHLPCTFDLSKPPDNFHEATTHPNSDVWHAAMTWEHTSLLEHDVFKSAKLPAGHKAIGVHWVFAHTSINLTE